jgi:hypothetical protein
MFDFAPVGVLVMLAGVAFMALVGRHLLPSRDIAKEFSAPNQTDLSKFYNLSERLFVVRLPSNSVLVGHLSPTWPFFTRRIWLDVGRKKPG